MNEIVKCEEIRQQLEKGLDGLDLFMDTWINLGYKLHPEGEVLMISPLEDIASEEERETLARLQEYGRAYLDGMNNALKILNHGR